MRCVQSFNSTKYIVEDAGALCGRNSCIVSYAYSATYTRIHYSYLTSLCPELLPTFLTMNKKHHICIGGGGNVQINKSSCRNA
mmetsp:Transcript_26810/g.39191  ORF Transcript_26810/g.39191 Transcript_26810/m.39191 type:complete len:83 (-) Transcript_26810:335-583(-)